MQKKFQRNRTKETPGLSCLERLPKTIRRRTRKTAPPKAAAKTKKEKTAVAFLARYQKGSTMTAEHAKAPRVKARKEPSPCKPFRYIFPVSMNIWEMLLESFDCFFIYRCFIRFIEDAGDPPEVLEGLPHLIG